MNEQLVYIAEDIEERAKALRSRSADKRRTYSKGLRSSMRNRARGMDIGAGIIRNYMMEESDD